MKRHLISAFALVALLAGWSASVQAQQIYRFIDPQGRITFSDQPPPASATRAESFKPGTAAETAAAAAGSIPLPYELNQVASRYPVTLYTSSNCAPCGNGRAYLRGRGIPYSEKTITTNEDVEALQRLSGDTGLPFLTVGGQQIKGFSITEWGQFLDAAGYPATSQLPSAYQQPEATPLVSLQRPPATPPGPPSRQPATAELPSPDPGTNPAGIRF
jgi:glutaredoxin